MIELDRNKAWLDNLGHRWEWTDLNGWVVDGKATWGGFWPEEKFAPYRFVLDDSPAYIIGQDFTVGDRIDLTHCECLMCTKFRNTLEALEQQS